MGHTKDLWFAARKMPDGSVKRVPTSRNGTGKRWAASWIDPQGIERSKSFSTKTPAERYWRDMESARDRGEYHDPNAGRGIFGDLARAWLGALTTDPATKIRYERVLRLHVLPVFGSKAVKSIQPSGVNAFLTKLGETHGDTTLVTALVIVQGVLDLAEADGEVKKNVARSKVIQRARPKSEKILAWGDGPVFALIDAHPDEFKLLPVTAASGGLRISELLGLAEEDIDYDHHVIHVRRQLKRLGNDYVFALPKNDTERDVPMPDWTAGHMRAHIRKYRPRLCSLPWETVDGPQRAFKILFRWRDGGFVKERNFSEEVWKPALSAAGIIGSPVRDARRRKMVYVTTRREGPHQLRHYYASVALADGVNVKELAEFLGHANAAYTLRVYAHLLPDSHDRARQAIDRRMFRPRLVADGT